MKKCFSLFLALMLALTVISVPAMGETTIKIGELTYLNSDETATATFGVEATLPTLTLDPADLNVTYESTNTAVATVDAQGVVTIVGAGTTTITAKFSGKLGDSMKVTVKKKVVTTAIIE